MVGETINAPLGLVTRVEFSRNPVSGEKWRDGVEFWLEEQDQIIRKDCEYTVVGTGHRFPDDYEVVGTTPRHKSGLVWHLVRQRVG
jgi:hypothetical protein